MEHRTTIEEALQQLNQEGRRALREHIRAAEAACEEGEVYYPRFIFVESYFDNPQKKTKRVKR